MSKEDEIKFVVATDLEKMFHAYCVKVLKRKVTTQLLQYVRYSTKRREYPLEAIEGLCPVVKMLSQVDHSIFVSDGNRILIEDDELAAAISELRDSKRDVLLLNVAMGYSLQETADALGLEYGSVRVYKTQAVRELRERLGDRC